MFDVSITTEPVDVSQFTVRSRNLGFLGFPKYEADTFGNVWSLHRKTKFRLTPTLHSCGYLRVVLCDNKRHRTVSVHTIVLCAFVGPCPSGEECRHLNRNRQDNRLENLAWGTHQENIDDRQIHGMTASGERHWNAKLSVAKVLAIKVALAKGETKASIARRSKISHATICDIAKGRSWRGVG